MIYSWSTATVAYYLGISCRSVQRLVRLGRLGARRDRSGSFLFNKVDVFRRKAVESMFSKQDSLAPDIVWVAEACCQLAKDVSASGFDPQCVLGVALGGVIPASIISVFLRRPLQTIRVKHYNGRKRLFCPEIVHEPDFVPQTSVLVVDDIIDSGGTLEKVRDFLDSRGVIDVRFATLHKKPSASFEPDWCVDVVTEWVDYPW